MRIVFAGTPQAAVPSLLALMESGHHEICGVVTAPDAPVGRRRVLTPSPVAQAAEDAGLPVLRTRHLDAAATECLREWAPELGVVVAFGGILPDPVLALPAAGWINLHFSLLPRWRGAAPVAAAVAAGDDPVGFSIMRVVTELDAGPVLLQEPQPRRASETAGDLTQRFAREGAAALVRVADALAEDPTLPGTPQVGRGQYAPKLRRSDARIDWTRGAEEVSRLIQAMSPEPGAWCEFQGRDLRLLRAEPAGPGRDGEQLGLLQLTGSEPLVRAGDGWVRLLEVQPSGRRTMRGRDWAHGVSGTPVLS